MRDVPTSHSVIFSMFGCTNPALLSEYASSGGGAGVVPSSSAIGSVSAKITNIAVNVKADHVKKMYEEAVMVRKVRHYLAQMSRIVEKNEERLRLISSTLEHSTSGGPGSANSGGAGGVNTLKRQPPMVKPSPNSSLGGSVSSINAALNLSGGVPGHAGISSGNGPLMTNKNALFGAHSPDAVKKLLALSETKVKTVKNSSSSSSVPLSQLSNSRLLLNTSVSSSSSMAVPGSGATSTGNTSSSAAVVSQVSSPPTPLSPKSKNRSVSSSQPINPISTVINPATLAPNSSTNNNNNKYSNESSSVSTIKLNQANSKYNNDANKKSERSSNNGQIKSSTSVSGVEADSGRASMASNVDQDQCSPTFQQRPFVLNRCKLYFYILIHTNLYSFFNDY